MEISVYSYSSSFSFTHVERERGCRSVRKLSFGCRGGREAGRVRVGAMLPQKNAPSVEGGGCKKSGCSKGGCGKDVTNAGREFERMVADATVHELEKEYNTAQMQGSITRDIIEDVINMQPALPSSTGERIIDLDALLVEAEANSLSEGSFIFEDDSD